MPVATESRKRQRAESKELPQRVSSTLPTPCCGLLASRMLRKYIYVVLSHSVCDNVLQQPQEMNTERYFNVFHKDKEAEVERGSVFSKLWDSDLNLSYAEEGIITPPTGSLWRKTPLALRSPSTWHTQLPRVYRWFYLSEFGGTCAFVFVFWQMLQVIALHGRTEIQST